MVSAPIPAPPPALVLARLRDHYGAPPPNAPDDPLAELVQTILSQHTSDANAERAFASLWARFGSWDAVRTAPIADVADAIRRGGLAEVKAPRIIAALETILARCGELSLDYLRDLDTEAARAELTDAVREAAAADHDVAYWLATAYALLGEREQAFDWLERAVTLGNENRPWFESNPDWEPLREDPRFGELMRRIQNSQERAREAGQT